MSECESSFNVDTFNSSGNPPVLFAEKSDFPHLFAVEANAIFVKEVNGFIIDLKCQINYEFFMRISKSRANNEEIKTRVFSQETSVLKYLKPLNLNKITFYYTTDEL